MTRRLDRQLSDAMKEHLITGKPPRIPEAGRLLWSLFVEISASRTYHAAGPHRLAFAEIEAWARLHRWALEPHHIETICELDRAWLEHAPAKRRQATSGTRTFNQKGPAMTAAMFDAVFG
jgi:hypothetical protein